jgi:hypothetical protein
LGIFNLPASLLASVDEHMGVALSPAARLVVWALVVAIVSMALYRACSRQALIRTAREKAIVTRRALLDYDGDFTGFAVLARASLAAPLRWLRLVSGPALVASLPVAFLIVFLDGAYGYDLPTEGQSVEVRIDPPSALGRWTGEGEARAEGVWVVAWPPATRPERLLDERGRTVLSLPPVSPMPIVHKRRWWNVLVGNPAGYLGAGVAVDSVTLGLERRDILGFGPAWMRAWEWPFFTLLFLFSVGAKKLMRVH